MFDRVCLPLATVAIFAHSQAFAFGLSDIDIGGSAGIETRFFTEDPAYTGQDSGTNVSALLSPEFRYKSEDRRHQFSVIPFIRLDSQDEERTHVDLREAYWLWVGDNIEVLTGLNKVFWGVAESRHLVNIINQIDGVEDIDGEDYLGQPMINVATQLDWGRIEGYILPGFRERTFPGVDGRFRAALPVDTDHAQFESSADENHIDLAVRYSHYFGDWDLGLSYFGGTDREPVFSANADGTALIPVYNIINQIGLDVQYTYDAWLLKLEAIIREGQGDTFAASVFGFEYSFYQLFYNAWDLGVLVEYQYDDRDDRAPITEQDNDLFFGARLALNDIQDTEVLAGVSVDMDTGNAFFNIEAQRRLGQNYELELRARAFESEESGVDAFVIESDDYIQLRLSRYF